MASQKSHTLRRRLVVPILAIVIVQALLYGVVFLRMNVMVKMDNSAYSMLAQHVSSRALYLQNQMLHRWSSLDQGRAMVVRDITNALTAQDRTLSDLKEDPALAEETVSATAQSLIYLLRTNAVTGVFLVLDAPGLADDSNGSTRAGLYIRDLDPVAYSENNSDLLLERAMPALTKKLNLPLSSYWRSVFTFEGDNKENEHFFFRPLEAATQNPSLDAASLGYWSPVFTLPGSKDRIVTYSQPLIAADGTVLGVLGIDLTENYLLSQLNHAELGLGSLASYALGSVETEDSAAVFTPMLASGTYLDSAAPGRFVLQTQRYTNVFEADHSDVRGGDVLISQIPLSLYDRSNVYDGESWVLAAIVSKSQLLSFSNETRIATYVSIFLSLVCAIIALFFIGRMLTSPIRRLASDLSHSDPSRPLTLPKLGIQEIDSLSASIETLSASVAAAASKFSEIIRLTGLPVGVFEYVEGSPTAFCSRTMCHLLEWEEACDHDILLSIGEFDRRIVALERFREEGDGDPLYRLTTASGKPRWLRIVQMRQQHSFSGSISDVTHEVLEKQKMQYERDYDTLSRLYNRRAFERVASQIFSQPEKLQHAALVMWDLDNLKYLNDTYGHDCGDQYILSFAALLSDGISAQHCITARRSGDEFYALFYGYDSREAVRETVETIYQRIAVSSLTLPSGSEYRMRASGGIAFYPDDAKTLGDLVHYADFAMYTVKHSVKGILGEFDHTKYAQNSVLLHGLDALDRLIDQRLVRFALQPILDVHTAEIYGYEMLMRPQLTELRSVDDVLRLARSYSKMQQIEHLTLFDGMETFVSLDQAGRLAPGAKVFLNSVASHQISKNDREIFFGRFKDYFDRLVLEITESDPYDTEITQHKIDSIRSRGGQIALDDYGSGFNSDAILLFLAPDLVKIDLTIIRDIHKDPNRQSVLHYLVSYAKPRGILVLAEGVETAEELAYVVQNGVDLLQGYYIAKPNLEPPTVAPEVLEEVRKARRLQS